ncbi:hypothetical protein [Hathewaya histolytica]|uniref:hypothetical protein n=1 Tax=Hathewaya histolytica TaxID=1498 RepID=UPI0010FE4773
MEDAELYLYDEHLDNKENVKLELHYCSSIIECSEENYFDALTKLRTGLEQDGIQILCKGANRNVYPSAMQLNMGTGRSAYILTIHKQATQRDVVDIFEPSNINECVSVAEQKQYFNLWIESFRD